MIDNVASICDGQGDGDDDDETDSYGHRNGGGYGGDGVGDGGDGVGDGDGEGDGGEIDDDSVSDGDGNGVGNGSGKAKHIPKIIEANAIKIGCTTMSIDDWLGQRGQCLADIHRVSQADRAFLRALLMEWLFHIERTHFALMSV